MMKFWSQQAVLTDSSAHIALGRFEAMFDHSVLGAIAAAPGDNPCSAKAAASVVDAGSLSERPEDGSKSSYLTYSEVRAVVNRASFFAQDCGHFLNTSIYITFKD